MTEEEKTALKLLSYVLPLTYIPVGLPLALKLIAPGGAYGIRTSRTLANLDVWYSVNFVAGVALILAGLVSIAIICALHRRTKTGSIRKLLTSWVISISTLMIAILMAFWLG